MEQIGIEIRLLGTEKQLESAVESLKKVFDVYYVSGLYACRGNSENKRQYIKVTEKEKRKAK